MPTRDVELEYTLYNISFHMKAIMYFEKLTPPHEDNDTFHMKYVLYFEKLTSPYEDTQYNVTFNMKAIVYFEKVTPPHDYNLWHKCLACIDTRQTKLMLGINILALRVYPMLHRSPTIKSLKMESSLAMSLINPSPQL